MFEKQNMPLKPVLRDTLDDRSTFTQLRLDTTDSRIRRKNKDKEMTMQRARSRTHLVAASGAHWEHVQPSLAAVSAFAGLAQHAAEPSEGASAETERMLSEPEPEPQAAVERGEEEAQAPLPAGLGEGQPHEAEPRV